jgi:hypothetical protein
MALTGHLKQQKRFDRRVRKERFPFIGSLLGFDNRQPPVVSRLGPHGRRQSTNRCAWPICSITDGQILKGPDLSELLTLI